MTCRTRFAPSPTGYLHIGGARTALYCWLEARRRGGQFILRIEDTDQERSTQAAIDAILDAMDWLGLDYDEGPIYQTQRLDRYREVAEQMVASGHAYYAYETKEELEAMREAAMAANEKPRYNGAYREPNAGFRDDPNRVIRFKNPLDGTVAWEDKVKGRIEISNTELDDLVIFRSDGYPTYNFAVVVDDIDMGITDVVRGDDHVNNTPRQINIYHALGEPVPHFAHMPMILDEQGAKLSKRTGAADVMQYRDAGYLPHALLNYLVAPGLVAWRPGDLLDRRDEVAVRPQGRQRQGLAPGSGQARLAQPAVPQERRSGRSRQAPGMAPARAGLRPGEGPGAGRHRHRTARPRADAEGHGRARRRVVPAADAIRRRGRRQAPHCRPRARRWPMRASAWRALPRGPPNRWPRRCTTTAEALGIGMGKVAQPLRVAITGTQVSPDISHTVYLAGQGEAVARIDAALAKLPAGA